MITLARNSSVIGKGEEIDPPRQGKPQIQPRNDHLPP